MSTRQRLLVRGALVVLAVSGLVAVLVVVGVFPPTANSWYPKCMSYQVAGIHCPGCGMTRAVHFALNGRLLEALSQNALVFIVVPYLLVVFLRGLWDYLWQNPSSPKWFRWPKWVTYTLLAVLLAFSVARNIPVEPFTLLAPHELPSESEPAPAPPTDE
jgi:hypothetical protein